MRVALLAMWLAQWIWLPLVWMDGGAVTPTATPTSTWLSLITHLRAHETDSYLVCRLLLEKKKQHYRETLQPMPNERNTNIDK